MMLLALLLACSPEGASSDPDHPCAVEAPAEPGDLDAFIAHIDALPRPIDATCLVQSLGRPLRLNASISGLSAQPSTGVHNPRLFFFAGAVTMSLVPEGIGAEVVEFGVPVDRDGEGRHTLKGELAMPIEGPIDAFAPHDKIAAEDGGTICATCHVEEQAETTGFSSVAIRTEPHDVMTVPELRALSEECTLDLDPERCGLLDAIFAGEVIEQPFPAHWPTIFDL
jgi:hypothetical protein